MSERAIAREGGKEQAEERRDEARALERRKRGRKRFAPRGSDLTAFSCPSRSREFFFPSSRGVCVRRTHKRGGGGTRPQRRRPPYLDVQELELLLQRLQRRVQIFRVVHLLLVDVHLVARELVGLVEPPAVRGGKRFCRRRSHRGCACLLSLFLLPPRRPACLARSKPLLRDAQRKKNRRCVCLSPIGWKARAI